MGQDQNSPKIESSELGSLEQDWQKKIDLADFYNADDKDLDQEENKQISPIYHSLKEVPQRYREESFLNAGGEKKIYRVYDAASDRFVAMARAQSASLHSEKEQFLREARLTAALQHPNIMSIYDMGLDDEEQAYFTMELLQGETLGSLFKNCKRAIFEAQISPPEVNCCKSF